MGMYTKKLQLNDLVHVTDGNNLTDCGAAPLSEIGKLFKYKEPDNDLVGKILLRLDAIEVWISQHDDQPGQSESISTNVPEKVRK